MANFNDEQVKKTDSAHIIVSTFGSILKPISGRGKKLDISKLRCLVIDEADDFLKDDKKFNFLLSDLKGNLQGSSPQWILFSATFDQMLLDERVTKLFDEAKIISLEKKLIAKKLSHIKQFHYPCEPRAKLDFIKEIFELCGMT
jgi:superfamily II DNA/RNA helicase